MEEIRSRCKKCPNARWNTFDKFDQYRECRRLGIDISGYIICKETPKDCPLEKGIKCQEKI